MDPKHIAVTALFVVAASASAITGQARRYDVPRTADGHPDFQGLWATAFLTMLERPPGVDQLTASPEQAGALVARLVANRPALIDPDALIHDIQTLVRVKDEYRTSVIVDPADGRMPLTPAGLALSARIQAQDTLKFDNIEDRPLAERCLENLGYAPMRAVPVLLPRQIVQTRDHVVIFSEDSSGPRIIHLGGRPVPQSLRSIGGYSVGHWEGDTLVVQTTNLRADYPARMVIGRPLPISRQYHGHRTIHPCFRNGAVLPLHHRRRRALYAAVERRTLDDTVRWPALRVRVSREQLQPAKRPSRRTRAGRDHRHERGASIGSAAMSQLASEAVRAGCHAGGVDAEWSSM